ncbi:MAG: hypothetical protein L0Y71_19185 [Gemmataceae bacterium]|nr:hypothetical protein [Gemmataceae bacterium]
MSLFSKCGVLLLAALAGWALGEYELVTRSPPEATGAALRQFDNDDASVNQLREIDAAKNAWLALWPVLLVLLAGLLFWDDVVKLCNHPSPNASVGDDPIQGVKP